MTWAAERCPLLNAISAGQGISWSRKDKRDISLDALITKKMGQDAATP